MLLLTLHILTSQNLNIDIDIRDCCDILFVNIMRH